MAITRTEVKVVWSAANTIAITTGSNSTSDLLTFDASCTGAILTAKADITGTPAAGDWQDWYILWSAGDPDGAAAADEFSSADTTHATLLGRTNTFITDPAIKTFPIPHIHKGCKIYTVNNGGATATCGAVITEQRSA